MWVPNLTLARAIAAAAQAASGASTRDDDAATEIQTALGTSSIAKGYRNDVLAFTVTFAASNWTISSGTLVPPAVSSATFVTADIDTGEWYVDLCNSGGTMQLRTYSVGPTAGTHDVELTKDVLTDETLVSFNGAIGWPTALTDTAPSSGVGTLTIANAYTKIFPDLAPASTNVDGRIAGVNAYWTGVQSPYYSEPAAGRFGADGVLRLGRIADPVDPSRTVLRITRVAGDAQYYGSYRTELTTEADHRMIFNGDEFWLGLAFKPPENAHAVGYIALQIHVSIPSGDSDYSSASPPFALFMRSESKFMIAERWNTEAAPLTQTNANKNFDIDEHWLVTPPTIDRTKWQYLAIKTKRHWDIGESPYTHIWHAQGDGAITKIYERDLPNTYRTTTGRERWKTGTYWMGNPSTVAGTQHHHYLRGFARWRVSDVPAATHENVIAFMRGYPA